MNKKANLLFALTVGLVGAATLPALAADDASSGTCGAHQNQLCPSAVVPQATNAAEIAKQIAASEVSALSIDQVVAQALQSVPPTWAGPTAPAPAPKQKLKLALISCSSSLHGCVTPLIGASQAAE